MAIQDLRNLLSLIQSSLDAIESVSVAQATEFPSLNDASLSPESFKLLTDGKVQQASTVLVAAAHQLVASVQAPQTTVFHAGCSYYLSASLRTAIEVHTVEILREAGPKGLHANEIAKHTGVDGDKLARVLRYLATNHIFTEVEPDVFANNLPSSVLDTQKAVADILAKPIEKYDGSNGLAALVGHCADEDYKGAGQMIEHMTSPTLGFEQSPEKTPMMLAFGSDVGVWDWFEKPDNAHRLRRFGVAMKGVASTQPPNAILKGFQWSGLPEGSIVADVGGGIGVSSIAIAQHVPGVRCIVQDRPQVTVAGTQHCESIDPQLLASKRVTYESHDFFDAQPVQGATIYLLKQILHDWSDEWVLRILKPIRAAAAPSSKLVLVETLIQYACPAPSSGFANADVPLPPAPLIANLGPAHLAPYITDLSMYVHFNAQERTLVHLSKLLKQAGWEVLDVHTNVEDGGHLSQIVAAPI